jgi:hypothetical protein
MKRVTMLLAMGLAFFAFSRPETSRNPRASLRSCDVKRKFRSQ